MTVCFPLLPMGSVRDFNFMAKNLLLWLKIQISVTLGSSCGAQTVAGVEVMWGVRDGER